MSRGGGISSRTRAAFYTGVAANLVAKASEWCHRRKLYIRKPELELEQAADILTKVDEIMLEDDENDTDLVASVADTRKDLVEADDLMGLSCHHSAIWPLKEHRKTRGRGNIVSHVSTPSTNLVDQ